MAKSLFGLSHCFMQLACRCIPENSPLTHRYPVLVYARVSLTTQNRVNRCSSFSPHSFAVLASRGLNKQHCIAWFWNFISVYRMLGRSPICGSGARSNTVYIYIEFNGEFAITGSRRHPKRDVTDTGKIARYWEGLLEVVLLLATWICSSIYHLNRCLECIRKAKNSSAYFEEAVSAKKSWICSFLFSSIFVWCPFRATDSVSSEVGRDQI